MASQTFRSLRERNARIFFLGMFVSNVGSWLQLTAMSLLVYRITGRSTDVGLMVAVSFLPYLVLGAWAGAVADRVDRRKMTLLTQSLMAVQAGVLAICDLTGVINMPIVYVMSLAFGVINAMDNPARRGFVTELVDPADIPNAMSLNTATMVGARTFGPALAAVLTSTVGTGWCFTLNAFSFSAMLLGLLRIDVTQLRHPVLAARGGTPVRDALRVVGRNKRLLLVFVALTVVSTFAFNFGVSFVRLADKRFDNEGLFGWLLATVSIGSLLGSLYTASRQVVTLRFFVAIMALLGAGCIVLAWAPGIPAALLLTIPVGFGEAGFIAATNSISQQECPPVMRSRILALISVAFLGSTPIGAPITGWIADNISAEWSLAYGGVIALIAAAISALVLARSRAARRSQQPFVDGGAAFDSVASS